ncbi:hypothetical protein V8E53_002394 [Lactarius tabidus]
MHASYQADSMSGASDPQEACLEETVDGGFTVTPVMGELYCLHPVNTPFDKKDARNKWFYNHHSHPRWSARNAFYQLNQDKVSDLVKMQSGLMPGHPQFLGALQNATTTLWNDLDNDLQEEYMQAAKDWSTEAPPKHIQSSSTEWPVPCISRLFKTFKANCTGHVGFDPLSLQHMKAKITTSRFAYTDEGVIEEDCENMTTKPIPVHLDADGFLELLPTTSNDLHKTKIIQYIFNIYEQGFITGKKTPFISWGSLAVKPSSWVNAECTPGGFEWKDLSKIKVGEIFHLLDHWRGCIDRGLQGLVWAPSCPLLQDEEHAPTHGGKLRQPVALPEEYSDKEVFILPQSNDIEQHESDLSNHEGPYRSYPVHDPFEEGAMDNGGESHPDEYNSLPSHGGQPSTSSSSYPHVSASDIAGPSHHYQGEQNRDEAIPKCYQVKGEWYIEIPEKPKCWKFLL